MNLELRTLNSELSFHPHRDPSDSLHQRILPEGNAMRSCRRGLAHREPRLSRTYYRKRRGLLRIRGPVRPGTEDDEKLVATNGTSSWRQPFESQAEACATRPSSHFQRKVHSVPRGGGVSCNLLQINQIELQDFLHCQGCDLGHIVKSFRICSMDW